MATVANSNDCSNSEHCSCTAGPGLCQILATALTITPSSHHATEAYELVAVVILIKHNRGCIPLFRTLMHTPGGYYLNRSCWQYHCSNQLLHKRSLMVSMNISSTQNICNYYINMLNLGSLHCADKHSLTALSSLMISHVGILHDGDS